jgi:hypothetical protein
VNIDVSIFCLACGSDVNDDDGDLDCQCPADENGVYIRTPSWIARSSVLEVTDFLPANYFFITRTGNSVIKLEEYDYIGFSLVDEL